MREFKVGDVVVIKRGAGCQKGVVVDVSKPKEYSISVRDDDGDIFSFTSDGRYAIDDPVCLLHAVDKMNKLEITKDNIWDIIDEKWKYIVVSETGTIILTEHKPELNENDKWDMYRQSAQNLCGLKVVPWWTDYKDSMLSRAHHPLDKALDKMVKQTPKFKVGDKCVYKGDDKDYYGTIVDIRDACDNKYPITFSVDGKNGDIYLFTEDGRFLLGMGVCLFHVEEYNELCNTKKTVEQSFFAIDWIETFKNMGSAFNLHKKMTKKQKEPKFKVGDKVKIIEKDITENWASIFGRSHMVGTIYSTNPFGVDGFVLVNIDGRCFYFNESSVKKIEKPEPKSYIERHKDSGLKVGDKVRVTRTAEGYEGGWVNDWCIEMNAYVGDIHEITFDSGVNGFELGDVHKFPYFVLSKVRKTRSVK